MRTGEYVSRGHSGRNQGMLDRRYTAGLTKEDGKVEGNNRKYLWSEGVAGKVTGIWNHDHGLQPDGLQRRRCRRDEVG